MRRRPLQITVEHERPKFVMLSVVSNANTLYEPDFAERIMKRREVEKLIKSLQKAYREVWGCSK